MTALEVHRDEGPLVSVASPGTLAVPEVVLLAVAAGLTCMALAADRLLPVAHPAVTVLVVATWLLAMTARWGRSLPRLDWPIPALLRVVEYGAVLTLVGESGWTYAVLAILAFHHYDIVYRRSLRGDDPPRWLQLAIGGWAVRLPVLVIASALGQGRSMAVLLAVYLSPLVVGESVTGWLRQRATARY